MGTLPPASHTMLLHMTTHQPSAPTGNDVYLLCQITRIEIIRENGKLFITGIRIIWKPSVSQKGPTRHSPPPSVLVNVLVAAQHEEEEERKEQRRAMDGSNYGTDLAVVLTPGEHLGGDVCRRTHRGLGARVEQRRLLFHARNECKKGSSLENSNRFGSEVKGKRF